MPHGPSRHSGRWNGRANVRVNESMNDVEFLALLVHHKRLNREQAEGLVAELRGGAELDALLEETLGWQAADVERLRRTRCGEIPEIPGYQILEQVGVGGTARVFRVRDKRTQKVLVLKVLKDEVVRHEPTRKAFIAEARLLEKLDHPGLVRCFGVARSGNTFFSRLEFVDGKTVLEMLEESEQHAFTEEEAMRVTMETAEALCYLEENGVVHRDVKPGNIMIGRDGRVVLIDLGFAALEEERAEDESAVGTVAYLSPEQARGGAAADCRSDIYSLGISLFHLVVGRLPFDSSDDREVLRMQVMDSLSSPELKGRNISPHLHYFIEKMVAKEADHRYQCWSELIGDIRAQIKGREDLDFTRGAQARGAKRFRRG